MNFGATKLHGSNGLVDGVEGLVIGHHLLLSCLDQGRRSWWAGS